MAPPRASVWVSNKDASEAVISLRHLGSGLQSQNLTLSLKAGECCLYFVAQASAASSGVDIIYPASVEIDWSEIRQEASSQASQIDLFQPGMRFERQELQCSSVNRPERSSSNPL